ncbi:MAG TPA: TonB-dependent receptor [Steroidobacteraceae bacterium]|nr:TonB-dependent receptor [Steroidobacteraceae bacterium]
MIKNNRVRLAVATVLSSCAAAAAHAADAGPAAPPGASGPAVAPAESGALAEVVVTAERRSETVQNVPITIQAITGEQLAQMQVQTFDDVLKYLPNVTFSPNGPGQGNIYMRGLSAGFAGNQSSAAIDPFPNVALYLDDQSMTFPARNVDVYMADMERVEVLEGPQGTLFGGGAEAGAVRYITNKPKLNVTEGNVEASYGTTAHGDPNSSAIAVLNVPVLQDTLAVRAVVYTDHRGGYIDNVPSTFTRAPNSTDPGPASFGLTYPANTPTANNFNLAQRAQNPLSYSGLRVQALWQFKEDWSLLIQQSYQNMEADGSFQQYPIGTDGQTLGPWEETSFVPQWEKDKWENTAWTLNGKLGDIKAVYTGSFLSRTIDNAVDYSNYTRSGGGFYYTCAGGPNSGMIGGGKGFALTCYSPVLSWNDYVQTTHQSHELRFSTPDDWRLRALVGAFWEDFDIKDDMNFRYTTIPSCGALGSAALAAYAAGTAVCKGNVIPYPGAAALDPTTRDDNVAFGEDLERGYRQWALFTSIDYDLIPKVLTLTGGTRYYHYTDFMHGSQYSTSTGCAGIPNGTCVGSNLTAATHAASYSGFKSRANLTWHVTPDAMLYYTFSQGFRPGAGNRKNSKEVKIDIDPITGQPTVGVDPNPTLVTQFRKPYTYPPDTLTNNEIGWKTEWLNHRLLVNGSAYMMDWKDVQTLIYNPPVYGNTTFGLQGPDYRIKGVELQLVWRATDGLTLQGSLSHNNASETNSPCIQSVGGAGAPNGIAGNPTPAGACITQVWNSILNRNVPVLNPLGAVGATPAFSPTIQYNLHARYDWEANDYKMFFTVGASHTGDMNNEPSSFTPAVPGTVPSTTWLLYNQPAYTVYDAAFGLSKDNWRVELYGQNLGNSDASLFTSSGQFIESQVPLRPRVLGLTIGMKF